MYRVYMSTRKRCPNGEHMFKGQCVKKEVIQQEKALKKPRKPRTVKKQERALTPVLEDGTKTSLPPSHSPHTPPGLPPTSEEQPEQMLFPRSASAKKAALSTIVEDVEPSLKSIKVPKVEEPAAVVNQPITPRTSFSKAYFTKPVTLLNTFPLDSESVADGKLLFQVSFTSPEQFMNYANLSKPGRQIDCLYQSLFSIGLREVNKAKMDSVEINEKGKSGVGRTAQKEYLKQMFGLRENQIHYNRTEDQRTSGGSISTKMTIKLLQDLCKRKLKDNHTTVIIVRFYKNERFTHGHAIIAYKYKGIVYFFDPQQKGIIDDNKIRSRTLTHLAKYAGNSDIGAFSFYTINELPEPREPVNLTCDIPYVG